MATTPITTSGQSISLKVAMTNAFKYPGLVDFDRVWVNDVKGVVLGVGNSGKRTVLLSSADFSDVISEGDSSICKAWTKEDLSVWLSSNYTYSDYLEQQGEGTIQISFTVEGEEYSGTATNDAEALALAILQLL